MTNSSKTYEELLPEIEALYEKLLKVEDMDAFTNIKYEILNLIEKAKPMPPNKVRKEWEDRIKKARKNVRTTTKNRKKSSKDLQEERINALQLPPNPTKAILSEDLGITSIDPIGKQEENNIVSTDSKIENKIETPSLNSEQETIEDSTKYEPEPFKEVEHSINQEDSQDFSPKEEVMETQIISEEVVNGIETEIEPNSQINIKPDQEDNQETTASQQTEVTNHKPTSIQLTTHPKEDAMITPTNIESLKMKKLAQLKSKVKKERVEDTHTRKTYLIRNDLLERMEQLAKGAHGFKIEFINFAIELALAEYEKLEKGE